jgi:DNA-binding MarR family transcriptional regulator
MYNIDQVNKVIDKNICILSRYSHSHADEKLKAFDLNKTQAEIVLFIYENDNLSLADINRYFLFNKATITKNIKHLVHLGLVTWNSSESDKRKKIMVITDKGKALTPEIIKVLRHWDNQLTSELNKEEAEALSELLYTITKRITNNEEY